jgi:ELWxxDGT repeat protein
MKTAEYDENQTTGYSLCPRFGADPGPVAGIVLVPLAAVTALAAVLNAAQATPPGPYLVEDINLWTQDSDPGELIDVNGTLFFVADDGDHGEELWKSDGTEGGTVRVRDIYTGSSDSSLEYLTAVDGMPFFQATDGVSGAELWTSDGTVQVSDIYTGSADSSPEDLTGMDGALLFAADDGLHGTELWAVPVRYQVYLPLVVKNH